jgi:hypothetical protein
MGLVQSFAWKVHEIVGYVDKYVFVWQVPYDNGVWLLRGFTHIGELGDDNRIVWGHERMKEEMKKEGMDWGWREPKKVYQRKNTSLDNYIEEGGIRGKILGMRNESRAMI